MELKSTGNLKAEFVLTENETRLTSFIDNLDCREELTVPEGIEVICSDAFEYFQSLQTVNFPRSLKVIENALFKAQRSGKMRINYAGTSDEFIALAKPIITEEYVPGTYDRYPYYSDAGASYRDVVSAFDTDCNDIEVYCLVDGVYLYYGKINKEPKDEYPLSREARFARDEAERLKKLVLSKSVLEYFKEAKAITVTCYHSSLCVVPCYGTATLYNDRLYLALPYEVQPYVDRLDSPRPKVRIIAVKDGNGFQLRPFLIMKNLKK